MPVNFALKSLATDGRFTLADANRLKQLVAEGKVSKAEAKEALERYGDVMDADASQDLASFTGGRPRGALRELPGSVLNGATLGKGGRGDDVTALQRALMAVGQRSQNADMILGSGTDGVFGAETERAVKAFQQASGLAATGKADTATLQALNSALRGEPARTAAPTPPAPAGVGSRPRRGLGGTAGAQGTTPAVAGPTAQGVADAAQKLVDGPTAKGYGVPSKWQNSDPRHAAPTGKQINGTDGKWKCNLFAGNVIADAGFEPPYYGNRTKGGEYPNANQLYKWSDKYAGKFNNQSRFTLGDEARNLPAMSAEDRKARVQEMFDKLKPGDLLIADHQGTDVADGGHCRVFLGKGPDGAYRFAQAAQSSAEVQNETIQDVIGEEHLWILRPNTPRKPL